MNNRKVVVVVIIVLIASTLITVGMVFGNRKPSGKFEKTSSNKQYVRVSKAFPKALTRAQEANGIVQNSYQLDLVAEVTGRLKEGRIKLKPGRRFRKGDVLATVWDKEYFITVESRKAQFKSMLIGLIPDVELEFPDQLDKWNKYINAIKLDKKLPKFPGYGSVKENNFLYSKGIYTEYLNIASMDERLAKSVVRAPYNGIVVENFVEPGAMVSMGTRVATVMKSGATELQVPLTLRQLGHINKGKSLNVYNEFDSLVAKASYLREESTINTSTQSVNVYFTVRPVNGQKLFINQTLTLELETEFMRNVVELPRTAVTNGRVQLWMSDSTVVSRGVSTISYGNGNVIVEGLDSADVVLREEFSAKNDSIIVVPMFR